MGCDLDALAFDAHDPLELARFWAGSSTGSSPRTPTRAPPSCRGPARLPDPLRAEPGEEGRPEPDALRPDQRVPRGQRGTVAKAQQLGGRQIDIGQGPDAAHEVMADPEGDEFDVIEPGNAFLAGCGVIGALACDGSQAVGYFWSEALGWPLVWDQDQETAIQSPRGGPKITWGGPPLDPKRGKNRVHFDLVPSAGSDQEAEVQRLVSLGATRHGHRPGLGRLGRDGGPRRQRVLRAPSGQHGPGGRVRSSISS